MKYILPLHLKPKPFNQSEKNLSHSFLRGQKSSALACHKTVFLVHIDSKHNIEPLLDWWTYIKGWRLFHFLPWILIPFPISVSHQVVDVTMGQVTWWQCSNQTRSLQGQVQEFGLRFLVKDLLVLTLDDSGLQTWLWLCPRGSGLKDFNVRPSPLWLLRMGVSLKILFFGFDSENDCEDGS